LTQPARVQSFGLLYSQPRAAGQIIPIRERPFHNGRHIPDARGAIHCLDLVYPQAEKRAWDGVVTRISRSLRPLEG
jgi:hypothetical protein